MPRTHVAISISDLMTWTSIEWLITVLDHEHTCINVLLWLHSLERDHVLSRKSFPHLDSHC